MTFFFCESSHQHGGIPEVPQITAMPELVKIFIHILVDKKLSVEAAMLSMQCYSYVTDAEYSSRIH